MSLKIRAIFGVAGVAALDQGVAARWNHIFNRLLIIIAMALLFEQYLLDKKIISLSTIFFADWFVWLFFVIEELFMLRLAQYKRRYLVSNWLNLLIIVAAFPPLLRSNVSLVSLNELRLILVIRLIPTLWDAVVNILLHNSIFTTIMVTVIITILWGELIPLVDPAISNPWSGIWLAWQTVTTIGYGDIVPSNFIGRLLAILLMIVGVGVGLTSLLTANFASFILRHADKKTKRVEYDLLDKIERLEKKIDALRGDLKQS